MSRPFDPDRPEPGTFEQIDVICDRFEADWQAGKCPQIEAVLEPLNSHIRSPALRELIALEIDLKKAAGHAVDREAYEQRFPRESAVVRELLTELETRESRSQETLSGQPPTGNTPPTAIDFPGTDRFQKLTKLGQGGFGSVYEVYDRYYQENCALKLLLVPEAGSLYRFKREFRTLAGLNHPNLISLRELFCEQNCWFFTMERVHGQPLTQYLRSPGESRLTEAWFARLSATFLQVIEGIRCLHAAGFVHRDLKPGNVLVTADGVVKILDLGLVSGIQGSAAARQFSREEGIAGTLAYMAPEQMAEQIGPACDTYAIGVMLFECLTGKLPFTGSALQLIQAKQRTAAPEVRQVVAEIPPFWNDLCAELLQTDPAKRLSLDDLRDRLHTEASSLAPVESSDSGDPSAVTELFGRDAELQALHAEFAALSEQAPRIVFVHGASGIGKTALTEHVVRELSVREQNLVILTSRCYERESVPYKALDGIMDSLSRYLKSLPSDEIARLLPRYTVELARLFPVLQRIDTITREVQLAAAVSDQQELRRRAIEALRQLLASLGDRAALILMLDDLHWGDVDSSRILRTLLESADPPRLLLIGTYRTEERHRSPCLKTLLDGPASESATACPQRELELRELPLAAREQLIQTVAGNQQKLTPATVDRIARESLGSPFFIRELLNFVAAGHENSTSLEAAILSRVSRLSETEQALLRGIAVSSRPISTRDALDAAQASYPAIEKLRAERLIRSSGSGLTETIEPYHDRIRETVAQALPADTLRAVHRELARVLERNTHVDAHTLAVHLAAAGESAHAAGYFEIAAAEASRQLAFHQAAQLYQLAQEHQPQLTRSDRCRFEELIGQAYASDGQGVLAARHFLLAADASDDPEQIFELKRLAMARLFQVGSLADAYVLLRQLLADVGVTYPVSMNAVVRGIVCEQLRSALTGGGGAPRDRAVPARNSRDTVKRVRTCWAAAQTLSILDPIRGYYFQLVGARAARSQPQLTESVQLSAYGACLQAASGQPSAIRRARTLLAQLAAGPACRESVYLQLFVEMCEGVTDYLLSRFPDSIARCRHALQQFQAECPAAWWEADLSRTFAIFSANFSGDVASLRQLMEIDQFTLEKRETTFYTIMVRADAEIVLQIAADDLSAADRRTEQLAGLLDFAEFNNLHFNFYLRRFWELRYRQQGEECWRLSREIERGYRRSLMSQHHWARAAYHLNRGLGGMLWLLELTHTGRAQSANAREVTADVLRQIRALRGEKHAFCVMNAELLTAGLKSLSDDPAAAITALRQALLLSREHRLATYEVICLDRLSRLAPGLTDPAEQDAIAKFLREQEIVNPERFFNVFAPGRWDRTA